MSTEKKPSDNKSQNQSSLQREFFRLGAGALINSFLGMGFTSLAHWSDYLKTRVQSSKNHPSMVLQGELGNGIVPFLKNAYGRGFQENVGRAAAKESWRGMLVVGTPALTEQFVSENFRNSHTTLYNLGNGTVIAAIDSALVCPAEVARTVGMNSKEESKGLIDTLRKLPLSHWYCGFVPLIARQMSTFGLSQVTDPLIKARVNNIENPAEKAATYFGLNAATSAGVTILTMIPDHLKTMAQSLAGTKEANKYSTSELFTQMCHDVRNDIKQADADLKKGKETASRIVELAGHMGNHVHADEGTKRILADIASKAEELTKLQSQTYRPSAFRVAANHFEKQLFGAIFRYPAVFLGIVGISAARTLTGEAVAAYDKVQSGNGSVFQGWQARVTSSPSQNNGDSSPKL